MQCNKCRAHMPLDLELGRSYNCIYCDGVQSPTAEEYLSEQGLNLVKEARPAQIQLAKLLGDAIVDRKIVIAEAGTGTGKTFAYLLPAVLSGERVLVSTAKKSLQSQLIEKDLPAINKALPVPIKFASVYGRGNYACQKAVYSVLPKKYHRSARVFFSTSRHGLWEEQQEVIRRRLPLLKPASALSAEHCTPAGCPHRKSCGFLDSRQEATEAQVVVTNHWLTGFIMRTAQRERIRMFDHFQHLIVDEAHKFESGVRDANTETIEEDALQALTDRYHTAMSLVNLHSLGIKELETDDVLTAWKTFFENIPSDASRTLNGATSYQAAALYGVLCEFFTKVVVSTRRICTSLEKKHGMPPDLAVCLASTHVRNPNLEGRTQDISVQLHDRMEEYWSSHPDHSIAYHAYRHLGEGLDSLAEALRAVITPETEGNRVFYVEADHRGKALKIAPIEVGSFLTQAHREYQSVGYLSATLVTHNSLDDFKRTIGETNSSRVIATQLPSVFDYSKQALLYVAKNVPESNRADALAYEIDALASAVQGNTFVLFTARAEMEEVHAQLLNRGFALPMLVQQSRQSTGELLKLYRQTPNSILLGLKSFWEGVDIQGEKLSLVIITKLPFPGKTDPIIMAKRERAKEEWFSRVDLPEMILDLRQGVGRLIRSKTDKGVVAILDSRLTTKRYSKQVLKAVGIPNITSNRAAAVKALNNLAKK